MRPALFRRLLGDQSGGPAIEFAFIALIMIFFTFGIMDMAWAWYQWNQAEKATQLGARLATVTWPIAQGLESFDCKAADPTLEFGDDCPSATGAFGGGDQQVICTGSSDTTATCGDGFASRNAEFARIVTRMKAVYPLLTGDQVRIIYRDRPELRWAGRGYSTSLFPVGGVVAEITVELIDQRFNFFFIGPALGFNNIRMPAARATLISESMNSCGQPPSGCAPS